ncbi:MAG TPA: response regulator [Aliidongia sp.]|uniref:response regulator n=1 Tax=Aliidongia sp. TaxID=1914230 RepID=UPI002DDCDF19|nr:response regulator [Aliidongia sp.]HEV2675860.1 response regulator [Aliidongia sp.]
MARILVIDDDPSAVLFISNVLEEHGHSVTTALNGLAGMQAFDGAKIDLVITDIVMPVQEGLATIMAIRRQDASLPILAISGRRLAGKVGDYDYLHLAMSLGAGAALEKPLSVELLVSTVERLLDRPVDKAPLL